MKQMIANNIFYLNAASAIYKRQGLKPLSYRFIVGFISILMSILDKNKFNTCANYITKDINGVIMLLDPKDHGLSRDLIIDGTREPYSVETVKKELDANNIVVDIGANIGYYALLEAKIVGDNGKVYAIEPVSENIEVLRKNIVLNKFTNIEVHQIALGSNNDIHPFYVTNKQNLCSFIDLHEIDPSVSNIAIRNVKTITLDSFLHTKPSPHFIRMDVEGYEYEILKGAEATLRDIKQLLIFIEVHFHILQKQDSVNLFRLLKGYGFEINDVAYEPHIRGLIGHKYLGKFARKMWGKSGMRWGHAQLKIDDILNSENILNGDCGTLRIFFRKGAAFC